jgi:hypothetical protein
VGALLRLPRALSQQPQQGAARDQNNPLTVGLVGLFNPAVRNARPVGNANIRTTRDGFGFSTTNSADYWVASDTALISNSPTWTILAILSGTSTNNPQGGVAFYAERPNDTQIVKLGMGDGQSNFAVLVVRDQQGNLVLQSGVTDVRTDTGKPRVVVGTRRGPSDHRLYVNGRFDAASVATVGGTFGATNAAIGNDPSDTRSYLQGASLPLVLVWNRALSDAEIAQVSANPWQVLSTRIVMDTARLVGLMSSVTQAGGAPVAIAGAWHEQNDTVSISAAATVRGPVSFAEANDGCVVSGAANVLASTSWAEQGDSLSAVAAVRVLGTAVLVEASDAAGLAGSVGSAVAANVSWSEVSDGASGTAVAKVAGVATWNEASDGATGSAVVGNAAVAAVAIAEQSDTIAMLATVRVSASAGWAEVSDLSGFTAYVGAQAPIDISKVHPSRIVVFEGSGSRVTPFEGSGSRVTRFE